MKTFWPTNSAGSTGCVTATSTPDLVRTMICCAATGVVVALLNLVADQRAADGAGHHRHVAAGAAADQAADAHTGQAAHHGAHARHAGCWRSASR